MTPRPQPLLGSEPQDQWAPAPVQHLAPVMEPVSLFERVEPRTIGLLTSMVLGGLLLVAVALVMLRGGEDASTAAGPGLAAPAALADGSPAPLPDAGAAQLPSTAETSTTLPVSSSTTVATTVPTTAPTTVAPTTAAPTTAPPSTTVPTTASTTTAPSTTAMSTTTAPPSSETTSASSTETTMSTTETTGAPSSTTAAPTTTVQPTTPTTVGPRGDDAAIQQQVLDATNAERAANGCGPLRLDPLLNRAADSHSEDMAVRNYFDHADPEGRGPGFRIDAVNYPHRGWGENIAAGYGSAEAVVNGWMNSSGHRANILNCAFDEIGIGYAEPGRYWTQLFATRG